MVRGIDAVRVIDAAKVIDVLEVNECVLKMLQGTCLFYEQR